jgi:hypothetical protein
VGKKKRRTVSHTIGGILVGFDEQVFRTTPPVNELVAKGTPLRALAADGGGTLAVGMPEDPDPGTRDDGDAGTPDDGDAGTPEDVKLSYG